MILTHRLFEKPIIFEEEWINVLVIENKVLLSQCLSELFEQKNSGEGNFILSLDSKEVSFSQVELIINPFDLDYNSKSILNHVYSEINTMLLDEYHYLDTNALLSNVHIFFDRVLQDFNTNMFADDFSANDLIKVVSPRFVPSGTSVLDRICDYIDILHRYMKIQLIIFINIRLFLDDSEMELLYKHIYYNKMNVLLIEQSIFESKHSEKVTIIDQDMCEFHNF